MESTILRTLITAVFTLIIVLLKRRFSRSCRSEIGEVQQGSSQRGLAANRELERSLRGDVRIQRLLGNHKSQAAAEAAIVCLVYERECPVESWRDSSTWSQVQRVLDELKRDMPNGSVSV